MTQEPQTKGKTDVKAVADLIVAMSTLDKLGLAMQLLEAGVSDTRLEGVLEAALDDLRGRRLLGIERAPLMRRTPEGS